MRVLSAIQPTGGIHLGNYLGALRHWVALQGENDCFFEIADLHSLTSPLAPEQRITNTFRTAAILLAIGIDPARATLFIQSSVHQHAELAWILGCFANLGELRRMTQFKEKASGQPVNGIAGLFVYPVLQAADILLYQSERIPVGEDQIQHLELAQTLAARFNRRFGATFTVPRALIAPLGARIMNLQDPRCKMSKSAGPAQGVIQLTDAPEVIQQKIRAAVTDSGHEITASADKPAMTNLLTIYATLTNKNVREIEESFANASYEKFKTSLADILVEALRTVRERYVPWMANQDDLARNLCDGALRAESVASRTLREVYKRIGLMLQEEE